MIKVPPLDGPPTKEEQKQALVELTQMGDYKKPKRGEYRIKVQRVLDKYNIYVQRRFYWLGFIRTWLYWGEYEGIAYKVMPDQVEVFIENAKRSIDRKLLGQDTRYIYYP